jgi:diacylglycerol kinase (ATP)
VDPREYVLANPAAGRGRARAAIASVWTMLSGSVEGELGVTEAPGDEYRLASAAIARGFELIVVVGGDGTCARVANAILDARRGTTLAVIPVGTGNDFAKSLGVENMSVEQLATILKMRKPCSIDVGRADGQYFLNSCGFGFDSSVLEASNRVGILRGNAVYIYAALEQLFTYDGIDIRADSRDPEKMLMVTVSIGRSLGGAFRIAPRASVVDGLLDVSYFLDGGLGMRLRAFVGALKGTHGKLNSVRMEQRRSLALGFDAAPLMEMDGELRRATANTVSIECIPRALSVIAAPNAVR